MVFRDTSSEVCRVIDVKLYLSHVHNEFDAIRHTTFNIGDYASAQVAFMAKLANLDAAILSVELRDLFCGSNSGWFCNQSFGGNKSFIDYHCYPHYCSHLLYLPNLPAKFRRFARVRIAVSLVVRLYVSRHGPCVAGRPLAASQSKFV